MPTSRGELESKLGTGALTEHKHHYGTTVYSLAVAGKDAIGTWRRLRQSAPALGYRPVVFGEPENLERVCEVFGTEHAENPAEAIRLATETDVQEFFQGRAEEFSGEHSHGEWPKNLEGMQDFTIPRKILEPDKFHESVLIGLVPAQHSWEVPAVLSFGGWNDCPYPKDQATVLRYWAEIYGAELVGLSGDVMELEGHEEAFVEGRSAEAGERAVLVLLRHSGTRRPDYREPCGRIDSLEHLVFLVGLKGSYNQEVVGLAGRSRRRGNRASRGPGGLGAAGGFCRGHERSLLECGSPAAAFLHGIL